MIKTINDIRYTMWATVIPRFTTAGQPIKLPSAPVVTEGVTTGLDASGYVRQQDPDSGEVTWVPGDGVELTKQFDIRCYARGYTNLGFRSSANRETYLHGDYTILESIQFDYPKEVVLNHQSFVTNIRTTEDVDGSYTNCLYLSQTNGKPIVWEVQGTTPVVDPFGRWLRNTTVLKRAEVQ